MGRHAPELIVVDHRHDREPVSHHGVELGEVEPHRSIADDADHGTIGVRDLGGDREGHAGPEAAEVAVGEIAPAAVHLGDRLHPGGGLAAIGRDDGIAGKRPGDLEREPVGMDGRLLLLQCRGEEGAVAVAHPADPLAPGASIRPLPIRRGGVEGANRLAAVGRDPEVHGAVAADLLGGDVDLDQARAARDQPGSPAAREEAEAGSQHQHQIGRADAHARRDGEMGEAATAERVIPRHQPVSLRVREDRRTRPLREAEKIVPGPREPGAAPGEDRRTLGGVEPLDGARDGLRRRRRRRIRKDLLRKRDARLLDPGEEDVDGKLEEHRTGPPRDRDAERLRDQVRDPLGVGHAMRPLGDRGDHRHLIESSLERHRLRFAKRRGARDEEGGHAVEVGVRDRGDAVGHARPRGDDGHARPPGGASPAIGGVPGRLLVAGVDQAHAVIGRRLEVRVQMSAVQREEGVDPRLPENPDQHRAAVDPCRSRHCFPPHCTPRRGAARVVEPPLRTSPPARLHAAAARLRRRSRR